MDTIKRVAGAFAIVEAAVIDSETLSPWAKLVYLQLCRYADRSGECFPGVKLIAARSGCSERTVRYAIRELEEAGTVAVDRAASSAGRGSNTYQLTGRVGGAASGAGGPAPGAAELYLFNNDSVPNGTGGEAPKAEPAKKAKAPPVKPPSFVTEIEQAYFEAHGALYAAGRLRMERPVYAIPKARGLIAARVKALGPEPVLSAIRAAAHDDWVIANGFSIEVILGNVVMTRLLNALPAKAAKEAPDAYDPVAEEIMAAKRRG